MGVWDVSFRVVAMTADDDERDAQRQPDTQHHPQQDSPTGGPGGQRSQCRRVRRSGQWRYSRRCRSGHARMATAARKHAAQPKRGSGEQYCDQRQCEPQTETMLLGHSPIITQLRLPRQWASWPLVYLQPCNIGVYYLQKERKGGKGGRGRHRVENEEWRMENRDWRWESRE